MRLGSNKFTCKYPNCTNKYRVSSKNNKHFYSFPRKDVALMSRWKAVLNISDDTNTNNYHICEDHFREQDFVNSERKNLNRGVVPLMPESHTPTSKLQPNVNNIIESGLSDNVIYMVIEEVEDIAHIAQQLSDDCMKLRSVIPEEEGSHESSSTNSISKSRINETCEIHDNTITLVSKLEGRLKNDSNKINALKNICKSGKLKCVEENLNNISKDYISSRLEKIEYKIRCDEWTLQEKRSALSIYKQVPLTYQYLAKYFPLPNVETLEELLSKIPLDAGINNTIMDELRIKLNEMEELDRYCVLLLDEVSLSSNLHYDEQKGYVSGHVDLGEYGGIDQLADYALILMVRGIHSSWNQIISYYFSSISLSSCIIKQIIVDVIEQLQKMTLKVVAVVCDQGSKNQTALNELISHDESDLNSFYFKVNSQRICIIYDVPRLMINTRDALLQCNLRYKGNKYAKFEHVISSFNLDQSKRNIKMLPRLKKEYFDFENTEMKNKVEVAAAQLSYSVASSIESWVSSGDLPSEALNTSEFVHKLDCLFDSLNGGVCDVSEDKPLKGVLKRGSPHMEFWLQMLKEFEEWKLFSKNGQDVTRQYTFIDIWQANIKSIVYLCNRLEKQGFSYFSLRSFTMDPLNDLLCAIRKYGVRNENHSCPQFVASLKTALVVGYSSVNEEKCEKNYNENLINFSSFL